MKKVKSCGLLCLTKAKQPSFLLMKHRHRYDLPKGHINPGETELQCALRELVEETGITREQVCLDLNFRYKTIYYPRYKSLGGKKVQKSLVIFLGWVDRELEIVRTEHSASEWIKWNPPHNFHNKIIDPLLSKVEKTVF